MGFYIRKALNFGPLRLNLSKSGLGVSVGVKGARVSMGPRGAYVHMGRHGLYYRQRIDLPRQPLAPTLSSRHPLQDQADPLGSQDEIKTADVSQLVDSSSEAVLNQINTKLKKSRLSPMLGVLTLIVSFATISKNELLGVILLGLGIIITVMFFRREQVKRTTPLFYELDDEASEHFGAIQTTCGYLAKSERVWRVESRTPNFDWKRNAGASSLMTRRTIRFESQKPPFIATNLQVFGANLGGLSLFFFPDQVLVFQNGLYGAVTYKNLSLSCFATRFIEDSGVPRDAKVVGSTWRYVRRDGGPDRRFSNNREIPIALYGHLELHSKTGMNVQLQVSNFRTPDTPLKNQENLHS